MGDQVFRFGKHRGRRFSEVARSDTSYVRWAKNQGAEASGALWKNLVSPLAKHHAKTFVGVLTT